MGKTRETSNLVSSNNIFSNISNDRVGIGTTTPQYKLDVSGDINFSGSLYQDGAPFSVGAGGTWAANNVGVYTGKSVGVNTSEFSNGLVGTGNSFQGVYISNGMLITDNQLSGNHYIGTAFNGLMAGPVTVNGTLTVDGVWVVI